MWNSLTDSRPSGRAGLSDWYELVLTHAEESGTPIAEAAELVGVTPATLYTWRRRLLDERNSEASASGTGILRVRVAPDRGDLSDHQSFSPETCPPPNLVIRLDSGRSIEVASDFEAETLSRVLAVLESC